MTKIFGVITKSGRTGMSEDSYGGDVDATVNKPPPTNTTKPAYTAEDTRKLQELVEILRANRTLKLDNDIEFNVKSTASQVGLDANRIRLSIDTVRSVTIGYVSADTVKRISGTYIIRPPEYNNMVEDSVKSFHYNNMLQMLVAQYGLRKGRFLTNRIAEMIRKVKGCNIQDLNIIPIASTLEMLKPENTHKEFVTPSGRYFTQRSFKYTRFFGFLEEIFLIQFTYQQTAEK